jgi:hypothetical protein
MLHLMKFSSLLKATTTVTMMILLTTDQPKVVCGTSKAA